MDSTLDVGEQLQGSLGNRYTLERELGRGGMAVVYLGDDLKHQRKVAVKVLHRSYAAMVEADRFLREIAVAASLQHPHILPVFDSGEAAGQLYYVMPYVDGESLRARLDRDGSLPISEAVRLTSEIADALDCAHESGIVHRDIKPENVLLSRGHALVADFGIARARADAAGAPRPLLTSAGFAVGTPAYMSPEQAVAEREIDGRSDEYSLACVAFEMLTGSMPFTGASTLQIAQRLTTPPPRASARRSELSPQVDAVLARAMALSPAERFATAGDFARALQAAAAGAPDHGLLPSGEGRAAAFARRHRRLSTVVATVVLAALVASGAMFVRNRAAASAGGLDIPQPGSGTSAVASGTASVAVLPFVNIGGDTATEYFADGITDELIGALSRVGGLRVPARTSVFALKGRALDARTIADTLGVATLLEGSVHRSGGRLRVRAQLVNATSGAVLWSESFDGAARDVFRVQDEITRAIVGALRIRLASGDSRVDTYVRAATSDVEAHDLYLRGRFLWNQRTYTALTKAAGSFQQAIDRDPAYAQAYAGLADTYLVLPFFGPVPSRESYARAKRAAERALALDSTLVEARTSLAYARMLGDFDWSGAERDFLRALRSEPNYANAHHWYAVYLWAVGRYDEAVESAERARSLDPLSRIISADVGDALVFAGRYDEAVRQLRATIDLDPTFAYAYSSLCWAHLLQRRATEAVAACERAVSLSGRNVGLGYLAMAYAAAGDSSRASSLTQELERASARGRVSPWAVALAHLGMGDTDAVLVWLERAVAERDANLTAEGAGNPLWRPLRGHPRFIRLRARMGLPP